MSKILTLIVGLLLCVGPAAAQGSWSEISCADSFLELKPTVRCHKHSSSRGPGDSARAVGSSYAVAGITGGVRVDVMLSWPVGDGTYIKAYTTENARNVIRNQSPLTRDKASNWSDVRGFANVTYMSFQAEGRACVGFDDAGPMFEYGYAWRLVGFACAYEVDKDPEAFVRSVLSALRVGPPNTDKSAVGEPVRPLSWPK